MAHKQKITCGKINYSASNTEVLKDIASIDFPKHSALLKLLSYKCIQTVNFTDPLLLQMPKPLLLYFIYIFLS